MIALLSAAALSPVAEATRVQVSAFEYRYAPEVASVSLLPDLRLRVEFRNDGAVNHQQTSFATDGPLGAPQGLCLNTPAIRPGGTFVAEIPLIPQCVGPDRVLRYFCSFHLHLGMEAALIVRLA